VRSQARGVFIMAQRHETTASAQECRLVFHRYGDRYFLRKVSFGGSIGYALPETDEERQWAERLNAGASGPVVVQVPAALV
jgi:hypothetical protein